MGGNDTTQSKRGIDSLFAVRLEEKDVNFPAKARKDNSYAAKKKRDRKHYEATIKSSHL